MIERAQRPGKEQTKDEEKRAHLERAPENHVSGVPPAGEGRNTFEYFCRLL